MRKYLGNFKIRKAVLLFVDCVIILLSALISNSILYLLLNNMVESSKLLLFVIFNVICCVGSLKIFGAYNKLWRYFDKHDYISCFEGVFFGLAIAYFLLMMVNIRISIAFVMLDGVIAFIGVSIFRYICKDVFIMIKTGEKKENKSAPRTMIIGGGRACKLILTELKLSKDQPGYKLLFDPVCIIDDNISKIGEKVEDVPIVGTTKDIEKFVSENKIEEIIFAAPSCPESDRKRIMEICSLTKLPVKVIPFIGELLFEKNNKDIINQIRDIQIEDLLGRDPIKIDDENIKKFIENQVCMVTGGGGSIGSEIVRQVSKYNPKQIIIIDIYENNAYDIQQELRMEYGDKLNFEVVIASVRDYYRMNQIFKKYHPNIVFHAAAHKHVPLMENAPAEAVKNNIIGTFNVATLADYYGVDKFIMISTDKAVNPTNVMGTSKRCCEMIMQYLAQHPKVHTKFITTRFGNVLGSNGSAIPVFKKQIEQGKPVTITHPEIIRYFMTVSEATSLVLEAATMAEGGEIFVLDMGKPVKILTLAENLIRMYGKQPYKDVKIEFIGLRPGEKIKEELLMDEEMLKKTSNKLIFIGNQIDVQERDFIDKLDKLQRAADNNDQDGVVNILHEIVPTFTTPEQYNKNYISQ